MIVILYLVLLFDVKVKWTTAKKIYYFEYNGALWVGLGMDEYWIRLDWSDKK